MFIQKNHKQDNKFWVEEFLCVFMVMFIYFVKILGFYYSHNKSW